MNRSRRAKGDGYLYKKRGRGAWRVRWTFEGKTHDESTGTEDYEQAKKVAKQKTAVHSALGDVRALTARLEKAKDERNVLEAKVNPSLNLFRMVDAFASCDVVRRRKNSPATIDTWHRFGNALIDRFGGTTEMRTITREQAEEFMREFEGKVGPAYFNHATTFYRRVWNVLSTYDSPTELKARLGPESPWKYILPMKVNETVGRKPFTPDQLKRIWRALDEIGDSDLKLLFDLARNTGARMHDLVSWKWDENITFTTTDDRFEAMVDYRPIKTMRSTGKSLCIPIMEERVVSELYRRYNSREKGGDLVFPSFHETYESGRSSVLSAYCQKVFVKAGLTTHVKVEGNKKLNCVYGLHSFRHTLVSELFNKGVDISTIQHLYSGHGSAFVTELYSHANIDKKRADLSNLVPIDVAPAQPPKWMPDLSVAELKALDDLETVDASRPAKILMKSILGVKDRNDLVAIKEWLERRIAAMDGAK